jgi:hypothetical protein
MDAGPNQEFRLDPDPHKTNADETLLLLEQRKSHKATKHVTHLQNDSSGRLQIPGYSICWKYKEQGTNVLD